MKKLNLIGIGVSALYLSWVILTVYWKWPAFLSLDLNMLGDFLGGSFGPLAFLWLVLGFFQQGEELRHSVQALSLQAEELRESVKAQRDSALANGNQFDLLSKQRSEGIWLETRKSLYDINNAIVEIEELRPKALESRRAFMSGKGALRSGAMLEFELKTKQWSLEIGEIISDFNIYFSEDDVVPSGDPDFGKAANVHELKYRAFRLRQEIITEMNEDKRRSELGRPK